MKIVYIVISTILLTSCALESEFIPKEGKTISQVNSDSYIYCAGRAKADRKYIVLEGTHPFIENIQIYKNTIFEESLSQNDFNLYKGRKCDEPLFFIDGKSISSEKVKELESAIPQEKRDAGIAQSKATKEAELRELKRKELAEKAKIDAETKNELVRKLHEVRLKIGEIERIIEEKQRWNKPLPSELIQLRNEEKRMQDKLNRFHYEEEQERVRQIQMQENDKKRKNEEYRNSEILRQKNEDIKLDACLNSGKISICALSSSSPQYVCGRVWEQSQWSGGFRGWVNKYCSDTSKSEVSFKSKNNFKTTVKDIIYKCESIAKSGTILGSNDVQIFDSWNAGDVKNVTLTIPRISQTNSLNCYAKSWK
jgi:hypothetical protein